ncbi:hypothetical protein F5B22DRAFT_6514 [Xylaria bambusicola]|uniref:uncharacterized protein n=1 Tax=Xylaria bambusicola TaxID=326684 RepID=UPI00200820CE|nr:uncharacterized protein F5B22DRAFT_6514 [Xylaria bambusicola]KAI0527840.1 hypothetical protein F5B22DRAFT_6514 [Xylaria bambusicola]
MLDNGACQTLGKSFHWGFSYIQLFILILVLILWTGCTCLFQYYTRRFPTLEDQPERPRGLRAILLLARAADDELKANGINPHSLTDKHLKRQVYKSLKGGATSFGFPLRKKSARSSISEWMKRDLPWVISAIALAVALSLWMVVFILPPLLFFPLSLAIFWAYFIGTTIKSRFLLALCLLTLDSIVLVLIMYFLRGAF